MKSISKGIIVNKLKWNLLEIDRSIALRHLLTWILTGSFLALIDPPRYSILTSVLFTAIITFRYAFIYYAFSLVAFVVLKNYGKSLFLIITILIFMLYSLIYYFSYSYLMPALGLENSAFEVSIFKYFKANFIHFIITMVLAYSFYKNRMQILELQRQSLVEKNLIKQELSFFNNDYATNTNFHFLEYCYSHLHKNASPYANTILTYTQMLRYTLDTKSDMLVPLAKEIEYIEQFIVLQKELISNAVVIFKVEGVSGNHLVLPRLFITYIENAFKHGVTNDSKQPISILLKLEMKQLQLHVKNAKQPELSVLESTGIGQLNARQQLDLFYLDKYTLEVQEDQYTYSLVLTIRV